MGRLVDCNDVYNAVQITTDNFGVAKSVVENNMLTMLSKIETVEAISKVDYEKRLKAEKIAMLEELNLEIDEMFARRIDYTVDKIQDLIQEKINALKGDK